MREWNEFEKSITSIDEVERETIKETARIVSVLIKRREELGWTQAELAARAGLKQSAVARLETSPTIPRLDTIQKVAHALGLHFALIPDQDAAARQLVHA